MNSNICSLCKDKDEIQSNFESFFLYPCDVCAKQNKKILSCSSTCLIIHFNICHKERLEEIIKKSLDSDYFFYKNFNFVIKKNEKIESSVKDKDQDNQKGIFYNIVRSKIDKKDFKMKTISKIGLKKERIKRIHKNIQVSLLINNKFYNKPIGYSQSASSFFIIYKINNNESYDIHNQSSSLYYKTKRSNSLLSNINFSYSIINEIEAKEIISNIVFFIKYIHKKGISLCGFSIKDIYILNSYGIYYINDQNLNFLTKSDKEFEKGKVLDILSIGLLLIYLLFPSHSVVNIYEKYFWNDNYVEKIKFLEFYKGVYKNGIDFSEGVYSDGVNFFLKGMYVLIYNIFLYTIFIITFFYILYFYTIYTEILCKYNSLSISEIQDYMWINEEEKINSYEKIRHFKAKSTCITVTNQLNKENKEIINSINIEENDKRIEFDKEYSSLVTLEQAFDFGKTSRSTRKSIFSEIINKVSDIL